MKQQDLQDAIAIARLLEAGTANRRDLAAFLIYIREHIPNGMVRDVCHFVAHDRRDRGIAFDYTENFVSHLIDVFQRGGILQVTPIYETSTLIKELCQDVQALGIQLDISRLSNHRSELIEALTDLLDGVVFELKNPEAKSCKFEIGSDEGRRFLALVVEMHRPLGGVISVPQNTKLAFSVFD